MSIVPSNTDNEQEISNTISRFISDFKIGALLKKCNCKKEKGIPYMELFTYILCNVFRDRSMYMQQKTGSFKESFSKNTYYRFLNSVRSNWFRFTTLLSERIVNGHLRDLTSDDRADCFVIDDSLYERIGYKHTELVSTVFDHVSMKYKKRIPPNDASLDRWLFFCSDQLLFACLFQRGKHHWQGEGL